MNWENILTAVLTGVIASAITGYLGVLYASKQFRAQRAFDRQLEWYERTVRTLSTLISLDHSAEKRGRIISEEIQKEFLNLERCVNEAILYAEQSTYEQLQKMEDMRWEIKTAPLSGAMYFDSLLMLRALMELSEPVRKMLGLKKIALKASNE